MVFIPRVAKLPTRRDGSIAARKPVQQYRAPASSPRRQRPKKKVLISPATPVLNEAAVHLCCRVVRRELKDVLWCLHDYAYRRLSLRASSVRHHLLAAKAGATSIQRDRARRLLVTAMSRWRELASKEHEMARLRVFGPLPGATVSPRTANEGDRGEHPLATPPAAPGGGSPRVANLRSGSARPVNTSVLVTPALALAAANADLVSSSGRSDGPRHSRTCTTSTASAALSSPALTRSLPRAHARSARTLSARD